MIKKLACIYICTLSIMAYGSNKKTITSKKIAIMQQYRKEVVNILDEKNPLIETSKNKKISYKKAQRVQEKLDALKTIYATWHRDMITYSNTQSDNPSIQKAYLELASQFSNALLEIQDAHKHITHRIKEESVKKKQANNPISNVSQRTIKTVPLNRLILDTITSEEELWLQLYWIEVFQKAGLDVKELCDNCIEFIEKSPNIIRKDLLIVDITIQNLLWSTVTKHQIQNDVQLQNCLRKK